MVFPGFKHGFYGAWENIGSCKPARSGEECGPGTQVQKRPCKSMDKSQKCDVRHTVQIVTCKEAGTDLPECPKLLGHWKSFGICVSIEPNKGCGSGHQQMKRSCENGTGSNLCSRSDMEKFISCEEAGTTLPDCPKKFGAWENIGICVPTSSNPTCGPGTQKMRRSCKDGTGKEKCIETDTFAQVSCKEAGTDLPDCPKILGKWKNIGPCISNNTHLKCGPGIQRQQRKCTRGTGMQKCTKEDILQFVSCRTAGSQLPDCPKVLSTWYNVDRCVPSKSHGLCGPGMQKQMRGCVDGTGQEKCSPDDIIQFLTCQEAGTKLPECPKTFGGWRNVGPCIRGRKIATCGEGLQEQVRTCNNGTGKEMCDPKDFQQKISCDKAGTDLPDCPRKFGDWINVGHCIPTGNNLSCGPGKQEQKRTCRHGTGQEMCSVQDKMQIISCQQAGTDLPDCPKTFGRWRNVGDCIAEGIIPHCGPGRQTQERTCTSGTGEEICNENDTIQVISCALAGKSLPECPKMFGEWNNVGTCITLGIESNCGPGMQIQQRSCKDGSGSQICSKGNEISDGLMKENDLFLEKTYALVRLAFRGILKTGSLNRAKLRDYETQISKIYSKLQKIIPAILEIESNEFPKNMNDFANFIGNVEVTDAQRQMLLYVQNQNHKLYIKETIRIFGLNETDYGLDKDIFCKFVNCKVDHQRSVPLSDHSQHESVSGNKQTLAFYSDTLRITSCENVNTQLQDCPKRFGEWKNVASCIALGADPTCGPGVHVQERKCHNGTGSSQICLLSEMRRNVSCTEIGTSLPECPKLFGEWENVNKCQAISRGLNCGPGLQQQKRSCVNGSGLNQCTNTDTLRRLSCKAAGRDLPDCPKILGEWILDGKCIPMGSDSSCGPGNQNMIRECRDGTGSELCSKEDQHKVISCSEVGTQLPDCPKSFGRWENIDGCEPTSNRSSCGPGYQKRKRNCKDGTGLEICADEDTNAIISCKEAGTQLPDCQKVLGAWKNIGLCTTKSSNLTCGPGLQRQERTCLDGTGVEICTEDDRKQVISCKAAGSQLPECPKTYGLWKNNGKCIATNSGKLCGDGIQKQLRTCTDGSGQEKCTAEDTMQIISCTEAGTKLPDCPKIFGKWQNIGTCTPIDSSLNCGPGLQEQQRTCTNGTGLSLCTPEDIHQKVLCKEVGTALRDCSKQLGQWINVGTCVAVGIDPSCGDGKQTQTRTCKDGTGKEICISEDRNQIVTCKQAGTELPECPKIFGKWESIGKCNSIGSYENCGPGAQLQKRTCQNGTGQEICNDSDTSQEISCKDAGSDLPDCPKILGDWQNVGFCIPDDPRLNCGPGTQMQQRTCTNGTGLQICADFDTSQKVSCEYAGTDLPDCPKIYGEWENAGNCVSLGENPTCGPGQQKQIRSCKNGTGSETCTGEDIVQSILCLEAGTQLPECKKSFSEWKNSGPCIPVFDLGHKFSCGPGDQKQTRMCIDGTGLQICSKEESLQEKIVRCVDAGTSLLDCPGIQIIPNFEIKK